MIQLTDIPHDMEYSVQDNLREEPADFDEMKKGIEFLEEYAKTCEEEIVRAKIHSLIGVYSRITWQLNKSEEYLLKASSYFKEKKILPLMLIAKIRLGHTYHWMEKFTLADEVFKKCLEVVNKSSDNKVKSYKDFILQHHAKSLFDQLRYEEALDKFLECHQLRIIKGDIDLINSTQKAISICKSKLDALE